MNTNTTRSKELLNKVYDHLDTIDVSKLSMSEMKDFLEVVQKGQFLETFGQTCALGPGLFGSGFNAPATPVSAPTQTPESSPRQTQSDGWNDPWLLFIILVLLRGPRKQPNPKLETAKQLMMEATKPCQ